MYIKQPFALLLFAFSLTNCSNENCEIWYEGDNCNIQQRDKFCGTYVGVITTYDPQGGLLSEGPLSLTIEFGAEINELRLTNQPDCVFVLSSSGEAAFYIPNYNGGTSGTVSGDGGFNGKTIFFTLEDADGFSQYFGSK
tara:strand:+ start:1390 stop:1806 length:417 start_codon:yes stop_codon:yes gene_type:complete